MERVQQTVDGCALEKVGACSMEGLCTKHTGPIHTQRQSVSAPSVRYGNFGSHGATRRQKNRRRLHTATSTTFGTGMLKTTLNFVCARAPQNWGATIADHPNGAEDRPRLKLTAGHWPWRAESPLAMTMAAAFRLLLVA